MYNHAKHLAARGHEVHVITSNLCYPKGSLNNVPKTEERDNFLIHRLAVLIRAPMQPFAYPSKGGLIIPGLGTLIASLHPDVVHAHNVGAPAWAYSGAKYAVKHNKRFFYSAYLHPGRLKLD